MRVDSCSLAGDVNTVDISSSSARDTVNSSVSSGECTSCTIDSVSGCDQGIHAGQQGSDSDLSSDLPLPSDYSVYKLDSVQADPFQASTYVFRMTVPQCNGSHGMR